MLAAPYDGSMMADRAISGFVSRWIDHFITSVVLQRDPPVRSAYVTLAPEPWHEVSVLKFVHQYFILDRPDLAMFQRGQTRTIEALVIGFDDWLSDRLDAPEGASAAERPGADRDRGVRAGGRHAPRLARGREPRRPSWPGWVVAAASPTSSAA